MAARIQTRTLIYMPLALNYVLLKAGSKTESAKKNASTIINHRTDA